MSHTDIIRYQNKMCFFLVDDFVGVWYWITTFVFRSSPPHYNIL